MAKATTYTLRRLLSDAALELLCEARNYEKTDGPRAVMLRGLSRKLLRRAERTNG
jgi:hypothetical protein